LNDANIECSQTNQLQTNACSFDHVDNIKINMKKEESGFGSGGGGGVDVGNNEAKNKIISHLNDEELYSSEENSLSASDLSVSKRTKSSVLASSSPSQFFPWMKRIHGNQYG
jgi:hypothetical protein